MFIGYDGTTRAFQFSPVFAQHSASHHTGLLLLVLVPSFARTRGRAAPPQRLNSVRAGRDKEIITDGY